VSRKYTMVANISLLKNLVCLGVRYLSFSRRRLFLRSGAVTLLFSLTFFGHPALATALGDMFRPYVDYEVVFDDNMLRTRDNVSSAARQTLFGSSKKFDISQRITGGLIVEKEISRQRFTADGNWSHTYFDRFSRYDHNAQDVQGNWNWFLGNRFEGNMGATYVHDLAPFLFQPGVKNLRDTKTQYFNGDWRFHSNWGLHSGYTHFNQTNGAAVTKFLNREEHIFDFGVNFYATDINKVGVLFRRTWGDFPASSVLAPDGVAADNSFDQNEVRAVVDWFFSGKSWVQFSGGWVERTNASFSSRDFNGFNARAIYTWQPTAKIGMILNAWRETGPVNALTARFSLNTGVSFTPTWDITNKLRLQGEVLYDNRDFNGFTDTINQISTSTKNKILDGSIGLIYKPYTGIEVSALGYHRQLTIDDAALGDMTANGASITIRYTFNDYDRK
jgi:exopolysaccharide biosynthesis operon protein EpsL